MILISASLNGPTGFKYNFILFYTILYNFIQFDIWYFWLLLKYFEFCEKFLLQSFVILCQKTICDNSISFCNRIGIFFIFNRINWWKYFGWNNTFADVCLIRVCWALSAIKDGIIQRKVALNKFSNGKRNWRA